MLNAVGIGDVAANHERLGARLEQRDGGTQATRIDICENHLHSFVGATDRKLTTKSAGRTRNHRNFSAKLFHGENAESLWA
jgi:hypothetical protein